MYTSVIPVKLTELQSPAAGVESVVDAAGRLRHAFFIEVYVKEGVYHVHSTRFNMRRIYTQQHLSCRGHCAFGSIPRHLQLKTEAQALDSRTLKAPRQQRPAMQRTRCEASKVVMVRDTSHNRLT